MAEKRQRSPEYSSWANMIQRCTNPKNSDYHRYGGRGIRVCVRWRNSFQKFLLDMGKRPGAKYTIDRYPNNDGNYEPGNCRWATPQQQARNNSRNNMLTIIGVTRCVEEWAEIAGVTRTLIDNRLRLGWEPEHAVFAPLNVNPVGRGGITIDGVTKSPSEWAKMPGAASARLIIKRKHAGVSGREAVFTPSRKKVKNGD